MKTFIIMDRKWRRIELDAEQYHARYVKILGIKLILHNVYRGVGYRVTDTISGMGIGSPTYTPEAAIKKSRENIKKVGVPGFIRLAKYALRVRSDEKVKRFRTKLERKGAR